MASGFKRSFFAVNTAPFVSALLLPFVIVAFDPEFFRQPPYWDSVIGVIRESLWLLDNQWDYKKLFFEEPGFSAGGARTYGLSLYPLLASILIASLGPSAAYTVLHLLSLLTGAGVAYYFTSMLQKAGYRPSEAWLFSLALICWPLFRTQSVAINMEIFIAFLFIYTAHQFAIRSDTRAWCSCTLALFTKFTGALAVFSYLIAALSDNRIKLPSKKALWFAIPLSLSLILPYLESSLFYSGGSNVRAISFGRLLRPYELVLCLIGGYTSLNLWRCVPDFLFLSVSNLILCPVIIVRYLRYSLDEGPERYKARLLLFSSILCSLFHIASSLHAHVLSRYVVVTWPLLLFVLIFVIPKRKVRTASRATLLLALGFLLNSEGTIYGMPNREVLQNNGHLLEHTLTYKKLIFGDMELLERISALPHNIVIATCRPYTYLVSDPRYGYVQTPHHVFDFCFTSTPIETADFILKPDNIFTPEISFPTDKVIAAFEHSVPGLGTTEVYQVKKPD